MYSPAMCSHARSVRAMIVSAYWGGIIITAQGSIDTKILNTSHHRLFAWQHVEQEIHNSRFLNNLDRSREPLLALFLELSMGHGSQIIPIRVVGDFLKRPSRLVSVSRAGYNGHHKVTYLVSTMANQFTTSSNTRNGSRIRSTSTPCCPTQLR